METNEVAYDGLFGTNEHNLEGRFMADSEFANVNKDLNYATAPNQGLQDCFQPQIDQSS
jgi:hypothetical protein